MKRSIVVVLVLTGLFAAMGFAAAAEHPRKTTSLAQRPDLASLVNAPLSDSVTGTLNGAPTYLPHDSTSSPSLACNADNGEWGNGLTPYRVYEIQVTSSENLTVMFDVNNTDIDDTLISVYCDPFDPSNPGSNLIYTNDDANYGPNGYYSAFETGDGITLSTGQSYWVVVTLYDPADIGGGNFVLQLTGATAMIVPVEVQSFTVD